MRKLASSALSLLFLGVLIGGCARTEIIESPRTAYVAETEASKDPEVIWTSRNISQEYDYLGQIKVRSWTYNGALSRLVEAGRELKADAVVDVSYLPVGFLTTMDAFAIKYKVKQNE